VWISLFEASRVLPKAGNEIKSTNFLDEHQIKLFKSQCICFITSAVEMG
jgi:hypothetical protein